MKESECQGLQGILDQLDSWLASLTTREGQSRCGGMEVLHAVEEQLSKASTKLLDSIVPLRTAYNSTVPINTLPAEILDEIFILSSGRMPSKDPLEPTPDTSLAGRPHDWLHCARVCRLWQNIIYASSPRWAAIDIHSSSPGQSDFGALCLKKSAGRLLNVRVSSDSHSRWMRAHLFQQSSRFKSLDITGVDSTFRGVFEATYPAHNLESLRICYIGDIHRRPELPMIFCGIVPRLQYLDFLGIFPWPARYITTLTHLTLEASRTRPTQFFDVLRHNPHLQQIILVSCGLAETPSDSSTDKDRLVMPDLTRLILCGCQPSIVLTLLDRLHCTSESLVVALNAQSRGIIPLAPDTAIRSHVARDLSRISGLVLHNARGKSTRKYWRLTGYGASASFDITVSFPSTHNLGLPAIYQLLSACNIQHLTLTSAIIHDARFGRPFWAKIFESLPALSKLSLYLDTATKYEEPCFTSLFVPPDDNNHDVLCPLLSELVLHGSLWTCNQFCLNNVIRSGISRRIGVTLRPIHVLYILENSTGSILGERPMEAIHGRSGPDGVEISIGGRDSDDALEKNTCMESFQVLWEKVAARCRCETPTILTF